MTGHVSARIVANLVTARGIGVASGSDSTRGNDAGNWKKPTSPDVEEHRASSGCEGARSHRRELLEVGDAVGLIVVTAAKGNLRQVPPRRMTQKVAGTQESLQAEKVL